MPWLTQEAACFAANAMALLISTQCMQTAHIAAGRDLSSLSLQDSEWLRHATIIRLSCIEMQVPQEPKGAHQAWTHFSTHSSFGSGSGRNSLISYQHILLRMW